MCAACKGGLPCRFSKARPTPPNCPPSSATVFRNPCASAPPRETSQSAQSAQICGQPAFSPFCIRSSSIVNLRFAPAAPSAPDQLDRQVARALRRTGRSGACASSVAARARSARATFVWESTCAAAKALRPADSQRRGQPAALLLPEPPEGKIKDVFGDFSGTVFATRNQPQGVLAFRRGQGVQQIPVGLKDEGIVGAVFNIARFLE
jgi:hypothetical protein